MRTNARISREIAVGKTGLSLAGSVRAGEPEEPYRADGPRRSLSDLFGQESERWVIVTIEDDTLVEFGVQAGDDLQLHPDPAVDDADRRELAGRLIGVEVPACGFMVGRYWPWPMSDTSLGYLELTGGVRVNLERTATIYGRIVGLIRPLR
jgi:hypothetical protein